MTDRGTVIVTGGGRGIGAAACRLAAQRGFAVCVNYRSNADSAEAVAAEIAGTGGQALAVQADVAEPDHVHALFERAAELGPLAALVNNAGITGGFQDHADTPVETMRAVLGVNVLGTMLCAAEAVRRLSTARGGPGGRIVNVSSTATRNGTPHEYVHYAAGKDAIDVFTEGLAREVAQEGIRVNAVAPGLTDTGIHASGGQPDRATTMAPQIPMGRAGRPEEPAAAILWLLTDAPDYLSGAIIPVAGAR